MSPTTNDPILTIKDLVVAYQHKPVLWNINLSLPPSQLISILGPNGAGKSTLLKAILGIVHPSSGTILFWGSQLKKHRKRISYVPQRESVDWDFPISVQEVVMMGRYPHLGLFKKTTQHDRQKVAQALQQVRLSHLAKRQISELSGGQQQRVFLARALAQEADLYLMDEPFSALDTTTKQNLLNLLKDMVKNGKTIIIIQHDLATTQQYFDWLILLNTHIIATGPTKQTLTKKHLQATYGNHPSLLLKAGELLEEKKIKPRTHHK